MILNKTILQGITVLVDLQCILDVSVMLLLHITGNLKACGSVHVFI